MVALDSPRCPVPKPRKKVSDALIYEIMDGQPIYRKGHRDVLAGKKTIEEIRGASTLQSVIVAYIVMQIGKFIDDDAYFVLTGESGVHIDHRNNLANDVAIYDQAVLTPAKMYLSKKGISTL